jgi:hypothetical protein
MSASGPKNALSENMIYEESDDEVSHEALRQTLKFHIAIASFTNAPTPTKRWVLLRTQNQNLLIVRSVRSAGPSISINEQSITRILGLKTLTLILNQQGYQLNDYWMSSRKFPSANSAIQANLSSHELSRLIFASNPSNYIDPREPTPQEIPANLSSTDSSALQGEIWDELSTIIPAANLFRQRSAQASSHVAAPIPTRQYFGIMNSSDDPLRYI